MRVVVISDTHNRHEEIDIPEGDVIVHCGDATGRGRPDEIAKFLTWYENLNFKQRIFVAGNHDFMFQDSPGLAKSLVDSRDIIYLEDESVMLDDVKFYGTPWQPWFHDWAFNLDRGPQIAAKWEMIPADTEFLITHGPPKNILDTTREHDRPGCYDLLQRIEYIRPSVHAFGHIHEGYGTAENESTIFVNASICTREYVPSNKPIVLERHEKHVWDLLS